jgi:hypothetical protein
LTAAAGRKFAWTLASAFAVLALLAFWRDRERASTVFGILAAVFFIAGVLVPTRLGPVETAWMRLAHAISRVTTPVFMGIVYFVVLTPLALVRRYAGKRSLSPPRSAVTFWVDHERRDAETARRRMERQF